MKSAYSPNRANGSNNTRSIFAIFSILHNFISGNLLSRGAQATFRSLFLVMMFLGLSSVANGPDKTDNGEKSEELASANSDASFFAGGDYTINFAAADPSIYIPPIPLPSGLTAPTGRGDGDPLIPLAEFNDGFSDVRVESLAPQDMALGQIVPFEIKITVNGDTQPEGGVITTLFGWNTLTTNGDDFGYDARPDDIGYGVYGGFIDIGDGAHVDPGGDATVNSFSWALINDEIVGVFTISGLDDGDVVVLEVWMILDDTIPDGVGGNVQSRLIDAATGDDQSYTVANSGKISLDNGDAISTGNQTVPLLKPADFFNADVDLSIEKSDDIDPIIQGGTLTYTVVASNAGPSVANSIVIYDELDPNVTFVSASDGGFINTDPLDDVPDGAVQWNVGSLAVGESVTYTVTVTVNLDAPTTNTSNDEDPCGSSDLQNTVTITTISDDIDDTNNSDCEPTDVFCFTTAPILTSTNISCFGEVDGTVTVTNYDPGLTYVLWKDGASTTETIDGSGVFSPLSAGTYFVVVSLDGTPNDPCEKQSNLVDIVDGGEILLKVNDVEVCVDDTQTYDLNGLVEDDAGGTIAFFLDGTDPAIVENLSNTGISPAANISSPGSQTYLIRSNIGDCFEVLPATLTINALPVCSITRVDDDVLCPGGLLTLTGPDGLQYDWSNTEGVQGATDQQTVTILIPAACSSTVEAKLIVTDPLTDCSKECTESFTIQDDTAPVLAGVPADVTVECDAVPDPANVTATDVCDQEPTVELSESSTKTNDGSCTDFNYTITRTWTATDACDNTTSQTQVITVQDTQAPTFDSEPADIADISCNDQLPALEKITASDNCGSAIVVASIDPYTPDQCNGYQLTYRWVATDDCGNSDVRTVTFNVLPDEEAPVPPMAPADVTIECDEDVPGQVDLTASDVCQGDITVSPSDAIVPGNCPNNYEIIRTWTFTDDCGNTSSVSQTITIIDTTPPVVSAPAALEIECTDGDYQAQIDAWLAMASANDGCDGALDVTDDFNGIGLSCNNTVTVTFSATDACGNPASATSTITIIDTTPPVVSAPAALEIECTDGDYQAQIDAWLAMASANDGCDGALDVTDDFNGIGLSCNNTVTVTFSATDACGNPASATSTITIIDTTPPVVSAPAALEIECTDGDYQAQIDAWLAMASANDGCDGALDVTDDFNGIGLSCNNTVTVTFSATDACGNPASATSTITIIDTTPPVVSAPAALEIECTDGDYQAQIDAWLAMASANDGCDGALDVTDDFNGIGLSCNNTVTVTFSATDACGNPASATSTITIIDTTPPVVSAPAALEIECTDGDYQAQIDAWLAMASANDGCDGALDVTDDFNGIGLSCNNTVTVTFSATDACGNPASATSTITIIDTTPPVVSAPAALEIECTDGDYQAQIDAWLAMASANDGCDGALDVTDDFNGIGLSCNNTVTVTFSATDACGNPASATSTITIIDTTPPVVSAPAALEIECTDGDYQAQIDAWLAMASANDGCDGALDVTDDFNGIGLSCNNTVTVTFSATDACGNPASATSTITIIDTTPPVVSAPAALEIECTDGDYQAQIDAWLAMASANDGCDGALDVTDDFNGIGLSCNNTVTVTFSATDACGNPASATSTITIIDTTPPVVSAPAALEIECTDGDYQAQIDAWLAMASANDGCDGALDVTDDFNGIGLSCNNTVTVTFSATDACGNPASATSTITIIDTTPPVVSAPAALEIECTDGDYQAQIDAWLAMASANDGCDGALDVTDDFNGIGLSCNNTVTVTFSATDACGNPASATSTITIIDTTPPVVSAPAALEIECTDGDYQAQIDAWLAMASANDGCDGALDVTDDFNGIGLSCNNTVTVTFSATDACGNPASATSTITIIDTTPPVVSAPAALEIECTDGDYQAQIDAWLAMASANDGCDGALDVTDDFNGIGLSCNNTVTVTFSATDACGNPASATSTITIIDTTPPVVSAPAALEIECTDGDYQAQIDAWLAMASANDGCDGALDVTDDFNGIGLSCNNTVTVTFSATDACGNPASATSTITIIDTTPPVVSAPAALEIECTDGDYQAQIDAWLAMASANDGCDGALDVTDDFNGIGLSCNNTVTVTFSATDACGNPASATSTITIIDTTPPVVSAPAALEIECTDGDYQAQIDAWLAMASANDGCDGALDVTDDFNGIGLSCNNTVTVTFSATDACGNPASATSTITIIDTTPPVVSAPAALEIECTDGDYQAQIDAWLAMASANDGCDGALDVTDDFNGIGLSCNNTVTVTFSATDACGNPASATSTITIIDTTPPVVSAPAALEIECTDGDYQAQIDAWLAMASANDGCDGALDVTDDFNGIGLSCNNTVTVTFSATDACGNPASATSTITIIDTTPPVVSAPAALEIECTDGDYQAQIDAWLAMASANDGCDGALDVTDDFNGIGLSCNNTVTVTFSATDACGNPASATSTITIIDTTPPVVSAPAALEIECTDGDYQAQIDAWLAMASANDGCDGALDVTDDFNGIGLSCNNTVTVTFSATDACGNPASATSTITIIDTTPPVVSAPAALEIECTDGDYQAQIDAWLAMASANDGCDGALDVTDDFNGIGLSCNNTVTVTFSATDACGNPASATSTITIIDTTPPVVSAPAALEIECTDGDYQAQIDAWLAMASANDGCDGALDVTDDFNGIGLSCNNTVTVTFSATDACGNPASATSTITIIDTTPPVVSAPAALEIECTDGDYQAQIDAWLAMASANDGCDGALDVTDDFNGIGLSCNNTVTVTFSATDACGNPASATSTITIIDTTPPVVSAPAALEIECTDGDYQAQIDAWLAMASANDGCDGALDVTDDFNGIGLSCNNTVTVTFSATDACGNPASATSTITIIDTTPPVVSAPAALEIECTDGDYQAQIDAWLAMASANDGCDGALDVTDDFNGIGLSCNNTVTVTFSATDACGNPASATSTITIIDTTPPVVSAPAALEIECTDGDYQAQIDAWLAMASANDGCDGALDVTDDFNGIGLSCNNTVTVTFSATDACGNPASATSTITIIDTTPPVVSAPAALEIECTDGDYQAQIDAWLAMASANDGCDGALDVTDDFNGIGLSCNNTVTVTFSATDACGNPASATSTITIIDTTPPVVSAPAALEIECTDGDYQAQIDAWLAMASANDGCDGALDVTDDFNGIGLSCNNTVTVTFSATDACGNPASATSTITIIDTTPPVVSAPAALEIECTDGDYQAQIDAWLAMASANDGCDGALDVTDDFNGIGLSCNNTVTVTFSATDACGNPASATSTITIIDTTPPVVSAPAALEIECTDGDYQAQIDAWLAMASANDGCDGALDVTDDFNGIGLSCNNTVTVTFSATDACGNPASATSTITIIDTTPPVVSAPAALEIECTDGDYQAQIDAWLAMASANDGCDGALDVTDDFNGIGLSCNNTVTVTFSATDACGNPASATSTITIIDTTPPVVSAPAALEIECTDGDYQAQIDAWLAMASANDGCDGALDVTDDFNGIGLSCNNTVTVTFSATDACGNPASATSTITIIDTTPPVVSAPAALEIECTDGDYQAQIDAWLAMASANDGCDGALDVTDDFNGIGLSCNNTVTVTFSATDACGNPASATSTITIIDTTPPVVSAPAALEIECTDGDYQAQIDAWLAMASANDGCDGALDVTDDFNGIGLSCNNTVTVTFSATDACGNPASATSTITIIDTTPPVVSAPAALEIECTDGDYQAQIDAWLAMASANDGCDGALDVTDDFNGIGLSCNNTVTVTFSATDACGNPASATSTITIIDTTPPVVSAPAALEIECTDGDYQAQIDAWLAMASANDGCDGALDVTDDFNGIGLSCNNTVTVTFSATDACGNPASATSTITIIDTTPPVVSAPAALEIECTDGDYQAQIDAWLAMASANDGCDGALDVTDDFNGIGLSCNNTVTVTFSATDACGNPASATSTITIIDTTPPVVSAPAALEIECTDGDYQAQIDAWLAMASANDGCDGALDVTDDFNGIGLSCNNTVTVTFSATDACGNPASATSTITIIDTTPPVVSAPAALEIECTDGDYQAQIDAWLAMASANDGCDGALDVTDDFNGIGLSCNNTVTVTFSATDACGNPASATSTITIIDTTPPVVSAPAALEIECTDGDYQAQIDAWLAMASANDGCDGALDVADDFNGIGLSCNNTVTVTFSATDACGNPASATSTITIIDTTPPVVSAPAALEIECTDGDYQAQIDAWLAMASANDGCDGALDVTDDFNGIGLSCNNTVTVTFSATDACGNPASATSTITIIDTTPPVVSAPAALEIECTDGDYQAQIDAWLAMASANDGCDGALDVTDDFNGIGLSCNNTVTVTFSATDACGNPASATSTITIIDTTPPVVSAPAALEIECTDGDYQAQIDAWLAMASANDGCDGALDVTDDFNGIGLSCNNTVTVTFSATDACGNPASATSTITIIDTTPPVVSAPAALEIECTDGDYQAQIDAWLAMASANDGCDGALDVADDFNGIGLSCNNTVTVTFSATDACGNPASATSTITIIDTTPPVVDPLDPINVECVGDIPAADISIVVASDCDPELTITHVGDVSDGNSCPEVITRKYRVTDACGNFTDVEQTITVDSQVPPTISCPANAVVDCNQSLDPSFLGVATATANCGGFVGITYVDDQEPDFCVGGTITRTWTAIDECLNKVTCEQYITVIPDEVPPVLTGVPDDVTVECDVIPDPANPGATDNCDPNPTITFSETTNTVNNETTEHIAIANHSFEYPLLDNDKWINGAPDWTIGHYDGNSTTWNTDPSGFYVGAYNPSSAYGYGGAAKQGRNIMWAATSTGSQVGLSQVLSTTLLADANYELSVYVGNPSSYNDGLNPGYRIDLVVDNVIVATTSGTPPDDVWTLVTLNYNSADNPELVGQPIEIRLMVQDFNYNDYEADFDEVKLAVTTGENTTTITRTWTATDDCENTATETQVITVLEDETPPTIICPPDITLDCGDTDIHPDNTGWATAEEDLCGDVVIDYMDIEIPPSTGPGFSCQCDGGMTSLTVLYNGSTAQRIQVYYDGTAGLLFDEVVQPNTEFTVFSSTVNQDKLKANTNFVLQDGSSFEIHTSCSKYILGRVAGPNKEVTVTGWTDLNGNNGAGATCDMTVPPVENCSCDGGMIELSLRYIGDEATTIEAFYDNGISLGAFAVTPGSIFSVISWTVDENKLKTETDFVIDGQGTVTYHTSCSDDIIGQIQGNLEVIGWLDGDGQFCGYTEAGDHDPESNVIIRKWIATDESGNMAMCEQIITLEDDNTPPVISCPPDITLECGEDPNDLTLTLEATATDDCGLIGDPTYTDEFGPPPSDGIGNCTCQDGMTSLTIQYTGNTSQVLKVYYDGTTGELFNAQVDPGEFITVFSSTVNEVKLKANTNFVLENGDSFEIHTSCSKYILGRVAGPGGEVTVRGWTDGSGSFCDESVPPVESCACDGGMIELSLKYLGTSSTTIQAYYDAGVPLGDPISVNPGDVFSVISWDADQNKLKADTDFELNGQTVTFHTSCSQDITGQVQGDLEVVGWLDGDGQFCGYTEAGNPSGGSSNIIVRTWRAEDIYGNVSTCQQIITLPEDNEAPILTCPPDITLECGEDPNDLTITLEATATDDCELDGVPTYTDSFGPPPSDGIGNCTCQDGMTSLTIEYTGNTSQVLKVYYDGTTGELFNAQVDPGEFITVFSSTVNEVKLKANTNFVLENGDSFEIHTSCSKYILGRVAGPGGEVTVRGWTDGSGSFCDESVPPVESCACDGGMIELSLKYLGTSSTTIQAYYDAGVPLGDPISVNPGDIFSVISWDADQNKLKADTDFELNGQTVTFHTSCSQDITGQVQGDLEVVGWLDGDGQFCGYTEAGNPSGGSSNIIIRTWTVSDVSGNTSSCQQIITLPEDDTPPVISCPADVTIACGDDDTPASTGMASAIDDCSDPVITFNDEVPTGDPLGCSCDGGMTSLTVKYNGPAGKTVKVYWDSGRDPNELLATFTNAQPDQELTVYSNVIGEPKLKADTRFYVDSDGSSEDGAEVKIHTSCSKYILGRTVGDFTVLSWTDEGGNTCDETVPPIESCNCSDMIELTLDYVGPDGGYVTAYFDGVGTEVLGTFGPLATGTRFSVISWDVGQNKLKNDTDFVVNGSATSIHTSCSEDITGVTFDNVLTVVGWLGEDGQVCGVSPARDEVFEDAECRTITRTWIATDANGNTSTCIQTISFSDSDPMAREESSSTDLNNLARIMESESTNVVAYPNPFQSLINLDFVVPETMKVRLEIYNMSGRLVEVLFDGEAQSDVVYGTVFDATNVPQGTYLYKLVTGDEIKTGYLVPVK